MYLFCFGWVSNHYFFRLLLIYAPSSWFIFLLFVLLDFIACIHAFIVQHRKREKSWRIDKVWFHPSERASQSSDGGLPRRQFCASTRKRIGFVCHLWWPLGGSSAFILTEKSIFQHSKGGIYSESYEKWVYFQYSPWNCALVSTWPTLYRNCEIAANRGTTLIAVLKRRVLF